MGARSWLAYPRHLHACQGIALAPFPRIGRGQETTLPLKPGRREISPPSWSEAGGGDGDGPAAVDRI